MNPPCLDEWVQEQINREALNNSDIRRLIFSVHQDQFNRAVLEKFQALKLRQTVAYVMEKSPFYRSLFSQYNIHPSMFQSLADLRRLPFTEPVDIIKDPYRFVCVPMGGIARIVSLTTSGTAGERKRIFFTKGDLHRIIDQLAINTKMVLNNKGGVIQIMLPGETIMGQADALARGVVEAGATPVVTGITPDMEEQIGAIEKHGSTILVGYSFYLHRLTTLAAERFKIREMGIESIVTTGEPLPRAVRKTLESAWGAKVFCHYGLTEMGFNAGMGCHSGRGYHIFEGDCLVEVIDPHTGQPVDGDEEGELVITSLKREGMPLIRYRTGDITTILTKQCECGSILKRIDMIPRRKGTAITIDTGEIHPFSFDETLFSIPDILDYRLAISREQDETILSFFIEPVRGKKNTETFVKAIQKAIEGDRILSNNGLGGKIRLAVHIDSMLNMLKPSGFKRPCFFMGLYASPEKTASDDVHGDRVKETKLFIEAGEKEMRILPVLYHSSGEIRKR